MVKFLPVTLSPEYRKEWNVGSLNDYFLLGDEHGNPISQTLYRVGGFGGKPNKLGYMALLKHEEAEYDDNITKDPKHKKHLASTWCIVDKNGVEKVVIKQYDSLYLVGDSILYTSEKGMYNIETGFYYGRSHPYFQTSQFIFIENKYEKDKSMNGVLKIDKVTGEYEHFT